ncbi:MAG: hypothetical protein BMS9Abin12_2293 [Acidimicrobiia bacterium]|nr:MAG: hypothetical protein BMS9Abin12_2293 [Acidimicrobiia bacterium]
MKTAPNFNDRRRKTSTVVKAISALGFLPPERNLVAGEGSFVFKNGAVVADPVSDVGSVAVPFRDLIPEPPDDVKELVEGYHEHDEPFATRGALFAETVLPFDLCTGTYSWNTVSGATDGTLANMEAPARHGSRLGATGCLNTGWRWYPYGTIQPAAISRSWFGGLARTVKPLGQLADDNGNQGSDLP